MTRRITRRSSLAALAVAIARCATLAVAAWLPALAQAQASARALVAPEATPGCLGAFGVPSGSPTSLVSIAVATGGNCTAHASGFAYLGVVGAIANTTYTGFGSNGAVIAEGSARWSDGLNVVWPERFILSNLGTLRLTYNIGATGGVSVAHQLNANGIGIGLGQASIGYELSVGSTLASGTMRASSGSPVAEAGQWGTITGTIEVSPTSGIDNDYRFTTIGLSLSGSAASRAIHRAASEIVNAFANAEFGSTLIWQGIVSAQAFDTSGHELALPAGFEVGLIGSQGGMNYWNAALRQTPPVPEPGTWALMLGGVGLLCLRRSNRRKQ